MASQLPPDSSDLFEKASQYALEDGKVLAYGLNSTTAEAIQQACDKATESYAKDILNWPHGRLAKPRIFHYATSSGQLKDLGDCVTDFVNQLQDLFQSSPPKALPIYPYAFIAVETQRSQSTELATLVLVYKSKDNWKLEHCFVPIHVKLGLAVESLRMGDTTAEDILDQFSDSNQAKEPDDLKARDENRPADSNEWAFALFSTGLKAAIYLPAMIDPTVDEVHPSEATLHLVDDPNNSQFQMSKERMTELFPIVVRDDERRGWRKNNMKIHDKVFIYCDNDKPKDKGVVVVRAEWDGNLDRKDKELQEAFGKAEFHESRVPVDKALEKACELAKQ